jgi:uncharacterized protein (DUF2141 family)
MPSRKPFSFRSTLGYLRFAPIILYLLVSSCANEAPPTGGKRDTTPPKVKYSSPANKSLNFQGNKIKIRFDEFIVQTIEPKEIVISPPMEKNPKFLVNGKNLIINLQSKLKDSTTYTINFGDAIKDNNENIPLKNFTFVFSTGNNLDSAEVTGQISNIKEPKNIDGIIIALYPVDSVDGILHSKPYYFAKTEKIGGFKISNIHSGTYRVYALKDENLNYIYDQANELIGFTDSTITISDTSKAQISLNVFESKNAKPKFVDASALYPGKILISYNSPIKTLKFNSSILDPRDIVEINGTNDTLTYWYSNTYIEKAKLFLLVNDAISDSTRLELRALSKDTTGDKKLYPLRIESQEFKQDSTKKIQANKPTLSPFKPIILNLSRPVASIASNKRLYVVHDSTGKKDTIAYSIGDKTKRDLTIQYPQLEKTSYTLVIPDSTFQDQWGWWNKPLYYKWNTDAFENFGNIILSLKFDHPERYYIFKILNQQEQPIGTFYYVGNAEKKLTLKNVQAGAYHLQAIDDTNKNGEWDSGDFYKKSQPEKIINFKETYELKGNWDLEIEVKL